MAYLISSEPFRTLEELRSSADHSLVHVVRIAAAGNGEVGVCARV